MNSTTSGTYAIDATHSNVEFAVKHMMISTVKGRFGDVKGTIVIPEQGQPTLDVTIAAASIDTRTEARDNHLRSADFFDVEKFPEIRFVSTKAVRSDDGWISPSSRKARASTRGAIRRRRSPRRGSSTAASSA
jgi:polyisoprenoid-binding protein YceI